MERPLSPHGDDLVPVAPRFAMTSCGWMHALAIGEDGSLWAWGDNYCAQLGLGDFTEVLCPTRVDASGWAAVSADGECSLGLRTDGSLWYWGAGAESALSISPRPYHRTPRPLGAEHDWLAASAGHGHCLALRRDGSLWSWGSRNSYGELGHGSLPGPLGRGEVDKAIEWALWCAADDLGAQRFCRVGGATDWAAISAGRDHSLALKRDGSLWAWGRNDNGQLGRGDRTQRRAPTCVGVSGEWTAISTFDRHSLALKRDGSLWAWGSNDWGTLGLGDQADRREPTRVGEAADWAAVSAGSRHSLALNADGSLWGWGDGSQGQLGLGRAKQVGGPARIGHDCDWAAISSGWDVSLALKRDGSLWTWGSNRWGVLGTAHRGDRTE